MEKGRNITKRLKVGNSNLDGSWSPVSVAAKSWLLTAACCCCLSNAQSQKVVVGRINLFSNGAAQAVYGPDLTDCYSTVLNKENRHKLGDLYVAQLWFGIGKDLPESALTPLDEGTVPFRKNGVFLKSGEVLIPGTGVGQEVTLQIRAWRSDIRSPYWNEMLFQQFGVEYGKSDRVTKITGGDSNQIDFILPLLSLVSAFPSFGLACVTPQPLSLDVDTDQDGLPDGAELGKDGRYLIVSGSYTLEKAEADAIRRGGHLASFSSVEEWSAMGEVMRERWPLEFELWLGGVYEPTNRAWAWMSGEESVFQLWSGFLPRERSGLVLRSAPSGLGFRSANETLGGYLLEFGEWTSPLLQDTDGDGSWDRTELLLGTSPNLSSSVPTLGIQARKRTELVVSLKKDQRYQIEYRVGSDWKPFGGTILGEGEEQSLVLDAGAEQENALWRLRWIAGP